VPPSLGGRGTARPPAASAEAEEAARRAAVRPGLDRPAPSTGPLGGGRPSQSPATERRRPAGEAGGAAAGAHKGQSDADELVEEDALWAVDAAAAPVIETPVDETPRNAGPALGRAN
jgi:hypothetical protein